MTMPVLLRKTAFVAGLALLIAWSLFPLWFAVVSSFSTDTQLYEPHYWPPSGYLGNYIDLFSRTRLLRGMVNSVIVGSVAVGLTLALALLAAYPLSRIAFPGKSLLLFAVLATTMFPQVAVLAGFYEMFIALGLYNTLSAVVLADLLILLPFTLWLMTTYMRALPQELEDIAVIDGAGPLTILFKVYLPLLWPGMAATGLLAFIAVWNEFLFAFTFTLTEDKHTAPVALSILGGRVVHAVPWGPLMAACVVLTLPCAVLLLAFQRKIVSGLTAGAVNG
jgi:trehalose/maltose transport system permease protein